MTDRGKRRLIAGLHVCINHCALKVRDHVAAGNVNAARAAATIAAHDARRIAELSA